MAQRNLPYLKLYVQDFMSDEKLNECSAEATGVYIRLMCIMHKNEEYGIVRLKAKDKHSGRQVTDLARKLARQMPYDTKTIERGLCELLEEGVLHLDGDVLYQKRMVHDGRVSAARSAASRQRWNKDSTDFASPFADGFASSFGYANEYANRDTNGDANEQAKGNPKPMQNCDYESESINKPISYSLINTELPNVDNTTSRAHTREGQAPADGDPGLAAAFDLYFDKIDPSPTPTSMELLTGYVEELGGDVVCRAINEAIDQGERRWSYIHGILKNYCADGVKSLDDVERREARHERRKRRGGNDNVKRDNSSGGGGPDIVYAVDGGGPQGT